MKNNNTSEAVLINGVVLTPECINRLKHFQDNSNDGVSCFKDTIADAVCLISEQLDYFEKEEDFSRAKAVLSNLSYSRNYLDDFKKP